MLITTPIGVTMAIGLQRWRGRAVEGLERADAVSAGDPEIVMGVALFLVFTQVYTGVPRGFTTQLLGHITFSISYVVVIVRGRLAAIGPQYEEAARDLGANRLQAMRLVAAAAARSGDLRQCDGRVRRIDRRLRDLVVPVDGRCQRDRADEDLRRWAGRRRPRRSTRSRRSCWSFTLAAVALAALVMRRMRGRQGGGEDAQLGNLAACRLESSGPFRAQRRAL